LGLQGNSRFLKENARPIQRLETTPDRSSLDRPGNDGQQRQGGHRWLIGEKRIFHILGDRFNGQVSVHEIKVNTQGVL
jgi:hypothetical protein